MRQFNPAWVCAYILNILYLRQFVCWIKFFPYACLVIFPSRCLAICYSSTPQDDWWSYFNSNMFIISNNFCSLVGYLKLLMPCISRMQTVSNVNALITIMVLGTQEYSICQSTQSWRWATWQVQETKGKNVCTFSALILRTLRYFW